MTNENLHERAIEIAKRFHGAESELIDILQQIDGQKAFVQLGFSSLFDYATRALKLSEANASSFIAVARKSKSVPELKAAIASGAITVSKVRRLTPVIDPSNSKHWIALAANLPKAKLEKEIARVAPETATREKVRYITEGRLELKVGLNEAVVENLKRGQDIVSQKTRRAATLEETLGAVIDFYLERHDPLRRAQRSVKRGIDNRPEGSSERKFDSKPAESVTGDVERNNAVPSGPGHVNLSSCVSPKSSGILRRQQLRRPLDSKTTHNVQLRDQGQCTFIYNNGMRCEQKRWLQVHHLVEVAKGGNNDLNNLRTLCFNHHKIMH